MALYNMKRTIESALSRIRPHIFRTPVFRISDMLSGTSSLGSLLHNDGTSIDGLKQQSPIELFVKCENMQKSGSFKFPGALNAMSQVPDAELQRGVVSYSTGNHAKALALASQLLSAKRGYHIPVSILMSQNATQSKIQAVTNAGAIVSLYGNSMLEAKQEAQRVAKQQSLVTISPADHEDVMAGQGTVMLEFMDQVSEMNAGTLDAVIMPFGGGSLLASSAITAHDSGIEIFGAKPSANEAAFNSISSDAESLAINPNTVADCLRCSVSPLNGNIIRDKRYVRSIYSTPESDICKTMALFIDSTKLLIEPGPSVPLSVVLFNEDFRQNCRHRGRPWKVGVVLTGGNITLENAHVITSQFFDLA